MIIRPGDPFDPQAIALLEASHALMGSLFPAESNHYLSLDALKAPHISFFVAEENEQTLGCAALANKGTYGELKSMFVAETARGKGTAAALLTQIEAHAKSQNLTHLRLETDNLLQMVG